MKENIIRTKSYQFALKIVKVYASLKENREFVLSKQLVRSGTSIGANIEEAVQGESRKDFVHKFSIAQKESFETCYWIRLLKDSDQLDATIADELMKDCIELQKIITAILKTSKQN